MPAVFDVSEAFDPLFYTDIVIKRYKLRLNEDGEYEKVGFSAQRMRAVVIPNDARASTDQSNFNVTESIQVYIKRASNLNIQTEITPSDYIVYDDKEYKVTAAAAFLYGRTFVRVLAELASEYDSD